MDTPRSPYTLTVREAAELAGVSRHVMYRAARKGDVPVTRLAGRLRIQRVPFLRQIAAEDELARAEAELAAEQAAS